MRRTAEVEALFGSASRGDSDHLSDRDILIVDSDIGVLNSRRVELEVDGFSVASYTWNKLFRLSACGALFLQHLKLKSSIIRDDQLRFANLLAEFRPKNSYDLEIAQNAELATIVATYPATGRGALWAADVLYVCLRNFGVLYLAGLGKYTFAFNSILEDLISSGCLAERQVGVIRQLRWMRSIYRDGSKLSFPKANKLLKQAALGMPPQILSGQCHPTSPSEVVSAATILPPKATAYHRLRNLEKLYVSLAELDRRYRSHPKLMLLRHWIENPRSYTYLAEANERDLVEIAISLSEECLASQGTIEVAEYAFG